jgi:cyclopropane fatty-acyl-phospholipid synthase-like methyltransferase
MTKPYSAACANNSDAILVQLLRLFVKTQSVLEIGSGTGQHATHFASNLQHLVWQTSDVVENHDGINCWVGESELSNLLAPIEFDVTQDADLNSRYDAIFMANTLHIMPWSVVEKSLNKAAMYLNTNGRLIVYGPFNYKGKFTSDSNQQFDRHLKASNFERGIRDFEKVDQLATSLGFSFEEDNIMPANNRLIAWKFTG